MDNARRAITATLFALAFAAPSWVGAESPAPVAVQNVLQLRVSGTVEVQQDLLTLTLGTSRDGEDPQWVQSQLRTALDQALEIAKKNASTGQMEVRTGRFNLFPRYGKDNKISGWQGSAEMYLEGRDFPRITGTAARIQTLNVTQVGFSLSRTQREAVESDAQTQAIAHFKAKAAELAKGFGFAGYTLREVSVDSSDQGFMAPLRAIPASAKAMLASSDQLPVEAGRTNVTVNVSGSVQLH